MAPTTAADRMLVISSMTSSLDWMLTRASDPVAAVPSAPVTSTAMDKPLGTQTFQLLDAMAYAPDDREGQTIYVRGLLIKLAGEPRMTISTFETVSPTCRD